MTMLRLKEMTSYWQGNPPVHLMVAAYLGIEAPKKPEMDGTFEELLQGVPMM